MMKPGEYKKLTSALGLSVRHARHLLGISERSSFRYNAGDECPLAQELLLRTMVKYDLKPKTVLALAGLTMPDSGNGKAKKSPRR